MSGVTKSLEGHEDGVVVAGGGDTVPAEVTREGLDQLLDDSLFSAELGHSAVAMHQGRDGQQRFAARLGGINQILERKR